jgi:hypothetical protein
MKMKSGPKLKGTQQAAPGGDRSGNHRSMTNVAPVKMKGKAVAPTQGVTRNHPNTSTSTGKRAEIGKPLANSYFANSRSAVHPAFDTKGKHD